jgi:hypothetical protein
MEMRRMLALALATGAILVLQLGLSVGGVFVPGKIAGVSLPGGLTAVQAHGPGGGNPDNNGDFNSGPDDGNGTHSGEKGNGGRGDCHCDGTNGNDKNTEGTSPK